MTPPKPRRFSHPLVPPESRFVIPRHLGTLLTFVLSTAFAAADDWPEFRGPTGQGIVAQGKLPVEWGPDKNVAWKRPIPGSGWSTPIIWHGRVYLTTSVPVVNSPTNDQSLRALCLDAATGKVLWNEEVFVLKGTTAPRIHSKNNHASPSPITDGERLYVHFGHQGTAALDLAGKLLWQNRDYAYKPVHGAGGSPILAGDALVFSCDGSDQQFVAALDRKTGKELWKTDRNSQAPKKFSFCTPLLITVNGQQQIVSPGSDMIVAYEPKTGREIWRVRYTGYSVVPRPVFGQGLVFMSTGYDRPTLLAIRADGQGDVTDSHVAWRLQKGAPHNPSPLLAGEELYMVSDQGVASCLNAKTVAVHWQERIPGGYSSSPLLADGKVYFLSEDGNGTVVVAAKQYRLLARNALKERTLASYAVADGALFIRTENNLYRIQSR